VPPRGRRLLEAACEGAASAGVGRGRGRGDGHAGRWEVRWRCRLAEGAGDHGDELQRVWPFEGWNLGSGNLCIWAGLFNFLFSALKKKKNILLPQFIMY
jgi:hypothetical protein